MFTDQRVQIAVVGLVVAIVGFLFLQPETGAKATLGAVQTLDHPALPFTMNFPAPLAPDNSGIVSRLGVIAALATSDGKTYVSVNKIGGPRSIRELRRRAKKLMGPAIASTKRKRIGKFNALRIELLPSSAALGGSKSVVYQFNAGMRSWVIECRSVEAQRLVGDAACDMAEGSLKIKRSAKPLAFSAWQRRVNKICRPYGKRVNRIGERIRSTRSTDYESASMNLATAMHYLDQAMRLTRQAYHEMSLVSLPVKNRGKAKYYIRINRQLSTLLESLIGAMGDPPEIRRLERSWNKLQAQDKSIARELGIASCSS